MTTKNVIIISAATCLVLNFLIWMLGWMVWLIAIVGAWLGAGHLSWLIEKNFAPWKDDPEILNRERFLHYCVAPVCIYIGILDHGDEIIKKINWLPSIRNPFVWPDHD